MKTIKLKTALVVEEASFAFEKNDATELVMEQVLRVTANAIYWQIHEPVYHSAVFGW